MPQMAPRTKLISAASAAAMVSAIGLITPWEGIYTKTYLDIVGVRTVCIGETAPDVVSGGPYTVDDCKRMLVARLPEYDAGIRACVRRELPDSMRVAFLSTTYNIGIAGFCGSSMARLANAGDLRGACEALLRWNKAGGKEVRGLTNRRKAERDKCLEGVPT